MADPTCDRDTLIEDSACLMNSILPGLEQKAAQIYLMVLQLEAIGGTDYTDELRGDLITDANTLAGKMSDAQRQAVSLAIWSANATAAGATVPADVNDWKSSIVELNHAEDLDAILLLLQCKLGVAKGYPQ